MLALPRFQLAIAAILCLSASLNQATRVLERRSDLVVPPVNASGWIVPLQGAKTCRGPQNCTDSLQPPPRNSYLQALAIGKGLFNYTCADVPSDQPPQFDAQYTQLYDAATLIPLLPDEETFHALIPMSLDYDYESGANNTLRCMGAIGTLSTGSFVTLYDIESFSVTRSETILAPTEPDKNAVWSHAYSTNSTWDVYRVETYGGGIPATCKNQPKVLEIDYVAEYWFYRHD